MDGTDESGSVVGWIRANAKHLATVERTARAALASGNCRVCPGRGLCQALGACRRAAARVVKRPLGHDELAGLADAKPLRLSPRVVVRDTDTVPLNLSYADFAEDVGE